MIRNKKTAVRSLILLLICMMSSCKIFQPCDCPKVRTSYQHER